MSFPNKQDEEILYLAKIREAIGCGHKPMLNELVKIVADLVAASKQLMTEHWQTSKFLSGFGEKEACQCANCIRLREIFEKDNDSGE